MCTRIFWNTNSLAKLTSRSMDWPESTEPKLVVFPRGRRRNGGLVGSEVVVPEHALEWTSIHGSLVTTVYGIGTIDGMNERGLSGHLLYLSSTDLSNVAPDKPGLQIALWLQYLLDLAATVAEAKELLGTFRPVMAQAHGFDATVHLAIEDATGDSLIAEFIDGRLVVHHGREFTLMTNDPSYDEQLALLAEHDFSKPDLALPIPGNVNAVDRFQRAAYYTALLPDPATEREAVAHLLSVARNCSVPFGAPYGDFGVYNTEYRTVVDVTNLLYFFELATSPNLIWTDLKSFDLTEGTPVLELDPNAADYVGDVSSRYWPAAIGF